MNNSDEIIKNNNPGFRALWAIYSRKRLIKSKFFWFSIIFSIFSFVICFISDEDSYLLIKKTVEVTNNILPNLLGFNIGAYVLLIAFITNKEAKDLTRIEKNKKYSLIQFKSSVFGFSLLVQATTLIFSYMILVISNFKIPSIFCIISSEYLNYIFLMLLIFGSTYSISLIIRVILNVFDLGQTLHFFITMDRIDSENK